MPPRGPGPRQELGSILGWLWSIAAALGAVVLLALAVLVALYARFDSDEYDRVTQIGMLFLFAVMPAAVGGLLALLSVHLARTARHVATVPADQPWLEDREWAARRIVDVAGDARGYLARLLIATIVVIAVMAVAFAVTGEGLTTGTRYGIAGSALAIVLVGVPLGWRVGWKYGRSLCHLGTLPGVIGGRFDATVHAAMPTRPGGNVTVILANVTSETTGSGRSARSREIVHWQATQVIAPGELAPARGGFRIPVGFDIPRDIPHQPIGDRTEPGAFPNVRTSTGWRLTIDAEFPGLDYRALFWVPVYLTDRGV